MLHEKRSKVLQIRLSEQEYIDLQNYVFVNYGDRFSLSEFFRIVLLDYIFDPYVLARRVDNNE